jgi:hypothetical protein
MRLFRGLSEPFEPFPANVTFASHMFRLDVAWARLCFNSESPGEISMRVAGERLWQRPEPERALPVLG